MREYADGMPLRAGWNFRRGDLYVANLNPFTGSEQGGTRPVLVIQNNKGNRYSPTLVVLPITSRMDKKGERTHYLLVNQRGLLVPSIVMAEQPRTIDKSRIKAYLGPVRTDAMPEINELVKYELEV